MLDSENRSDTLEAVLREETIALSNLYACQKRMYGSVLVRDWPTLQKETEESEKISNAFLELEGKRIELARALCVDADGSKDFYKITANMSEMQRSRVNALFRDVKRLLLLSKTENDVFNTYISNARTMVAGIIDTALPARRNRIYTRRGSLASASVESMVLNRSF